MMFFNNFYSGCTNKCKLSRSLTNAKTRYYLVGRIDLLIVLVLSKKKSILTTTWITCQKMALFNLLSFITNVEQPLLILFLRYESWSILFRDMHHILLDTAVSLYSINVLFCNTDTATNNNTRRNPAWSAVPPIVSCPLGRSGAFVMQSADMVWGIGPQK